MSDCYLLIARNILQVFSFGEESRAARHHIVLTRQPCNKVRFGPGEQREPFLIAETPFRSWKKPLAQKPHRICSKLFVVLGGLAHLVQLKEHQTTIYALRFKFKL